MLDRYSLGFGTLQHRVDGLRDWKIRWAGGGSGGGMREGVRSRGEEREKEDKKDGDGLTEREERTGTHSHGRRDTRNDRNKAQRTRNPSRNTLDSYTHNILTASLHLLTTKRLPQKTSCPSSLELERTRDTTTKTSLSRSMKHLLPLGAGRSTRNNSLQLD